MENLTINELIEINGGHDGTAYEIGQAIGTVLKVVSLARTVTFGWSMIRKIF